MKIRLVEDELFHADVRTDMSKEFYESAYKRVIIYREKLGEIQSQCVYGSEI